MYVDMYENGKKFDFHEWCGGRGGQSGVCTGEKITFPSALAKYQDVPVQYISMNPF
jgi:hypothetical protein